MFSTKSWFCSNVLLNFHCCVRPGRVCVCVVLIVARTALWSVNFCVSGKCFAWMTFFFYQNFMNMCIFYKSSNFTFLFA